MLPQSINFYASVPDVRTQLSYSDGGVDDVIWVYLRAASRAIDNHCKRQFYVTTGNKIIQPGANERAEMEIPDCLRINTIDVDTDEDFDYADESWVYGQDYVLSSAQAFYPSALPGRQIRVLSNGRYALNPSHRYRINAEWGFGDGYNSLPAEFANSTCSVADGESTTIALTTGHLVEPGHTIYVEGEAMFVQAVDVDEATVVRAVNGTMGRYHDDPEMVSIYRYPEMVRQCCIDMAVEGIFTRSDSSSQIEVAAGQFQFARFEEIAYRHLRMLDQYRIWRAM